jgi:PPE-repeat protein
MQQWISHYYHRKSIPEDGLAAELQSAAASYASVISGLTAGPWLGPASASMAAAAGPYVAWMNTTATQAEQTATQAKAAAAAYEAAFAATVPPWVVAANRALLMALVATNLFGQNTPAIAATEAHYAEMWAQDATAMYGYGGASASATALTPFTPAPQTTTGTSAAANAQMAASQAISTALQGLAAPAATNATPGAALATLSNLSGVTLFWPGVAQAGLTPLNTTSEFVGFTYDDSENRDATTHVKEDQILDTLRINKFRLPEGVFDSGFTPVMALGPADAPSMTAALGRAPVVGGLSVPPGWTAAAPAIRLTAVALPATSLGAAPEAFAGSPGSLFSEMALASMAGRAIGGTVTRSGRERVGATTRSYPAPSPRSPGGPMTGIAAEIDELTELLGKLGALRDSGILTDEEFNVQKQRLLVH